MYQITLEVTQVTPRTWLEVGHIKTIKMDQALPVGSEINDFGHVAKVVDVQEIEETPWTEEQEKKMQANMAKDINASFDRRTRRIFNSWKICQKSLLYSPH